MKKSRILSRIDHTELRPTATRDDYARLCEEAKRYGVASVCVPPSWVSFCQNFLRCTSVHICTVVGFPLGYDDTEVKVYAAQRAIMDGATEIDVVINVGLVLSANQLDSTPFQEVQDELRMLRRTCNGDVILKVIVETCYLNEAQKINLCNIVTDVGADYIKTSTGFGTGGATLEDVKLFRDYIGPEVRIKAAGGISTIEDAKKFIEAGCSRIGSSKLVRLLSEIEDDEV